jgi:hypothetical protein
MCELLGPEIYNPCLIVTSSIDNSSAHYAFIFQEKQHVTNFPWAITQNDHMSSYIFIIRQDPHIIDVTNLKVNHRQPVYA